MMYHFKKKYKFTCACCGKDKITVDFSRKLCVSCENWGKPGVGQANLLKFASK